jgi:two-component system, response regulator
MDRTAVILLVEDDEDHAMMATIAFEDLDVGYRIYWVRDGKEAMDYLYRMGTFVNPEDSPRPDLILLDLRLPLIDGHEVLKATKESCELREIPVVVLTSSQNQADISRAYSNYANSYLVKPMNSDTLVKMIGSIGVYWLKWNQHPGEFDQNLTG